MDVKVAKEVKAVTAGVPIFDVVAVILLMVISQFSIPMLMGIIFGSIIAVLNFILMMLSRLSLRRKQIQKSNIKVGYGR